MYDQIRVKYSSVENYVVCLNWGLGKVIQGSRMITLVKVESESKVKALLLYSAARPDGFSSALQPYP